MGELIKDGDGKAVTPEQKQGEEGQLGPRPTDDFVLIIQFNKATRQIQVRGGIANIGLCYQVLEQAKDVVRKWNELNNGYLEAEPINQKGKSMVEKVKGAFGKK